jgi:type IV pilus assembly protein PilB
MLFSKDPKDKKAAPTPPPSSNEAPPLFGIALVESGLISQEQLQAVLKAQTKSKQRIGEIAVSLGFISATDLAKFLAKRFDVPFVELGAETELDTAVVELIPEDLARRYCIILFRKEGSTVTIAMADPLDVRAVDAVRLATGCHVRKTVSSSSAIQRAIDNSYHAPDRLERSLGKLLNVEGAAEPVAQEADESEDNALGIDQLKLQASDAPVVQFVNLTLMRAVQERASDIHIEPEEYTISVRFRIDGQLREMTSPPKAMFQAVATRLKLLSNLDIAERRLPQDGHFKFHVFDKQIDVRVSSLPTIYGEKIVLRILDRSNLILDMGTLGFEPAMQDVFRRTLGLPYGLIILTGPTGSGKTTTLYAALNTVKSLNKETAKNIVTIEDPVEYQISKINQVHAKPEIGLTFAAGLRSILRQDPDVIMVGEIRDQETAEICIRAALTGHLVLSTLHTNDSISAVTRLTDMGIEPFLLASTMNLIMAQRLVRRICPECSEEWVPPQNILERVTRTITRTDDQGAWKFRRGRGCDHCGKSGYSGRVAVYEQFVVSDPIRRLITEKAPLNKLLEVARKEGFQSLLQSALNKAAEGLTTVEEAFSICSTQSEVLQTE